MAAQPPSTLGSAFARGLSGRCPRCGEGRLFDGLLTVRPRCDACGLDYAFADAGDGPAVFVILIAGFIVAGSALIVEFIYQPPLWPLKGLLIALQHHFQAEEGRIDHLGRGGDR
jgi:uncharacterized protein (DUF983 family)